MSIDVPEEYRYNERNVLAERNGESIYEREIKMLLGDPYNFAIITKTINEWNITSDTWHNGVLLFCVDGAIFPKRILMAPLASEIAPLKENLENISVNKKIFNMKKREAFEHIYNITFPEDWDEDSDYQYEITPLTFPEDNCDIFAVSDGDQVRILAAKCPCNKDKMRPTFKNATIKEAVISVQELKEIAKALEID